MTKGHYRRGPARGVVAAALVGALAGAGAPTRARAQEADTTKSRVQALDLSGGADQSLEDLTGESSFPLQITGFGVGNYAYDGRTNDNTFAAGKLAVSMFREMGSSFWVFGQLTTSLAEEGGGGDVPTEIEIDNLIVNFTPPGATNLSFSFGKFDTPIGFERDDEPLNLQPTESFNFQYARPAKMVGLIGRWNLTPAVDIAGWVGNGWDSQIDPNHGKTAGLRLGARPTENSSLGLAGLYGPEGDQGDSFDRYLLTFDYALQPTPDVIVAGEASYGGDRQVQANGSDANWYGALLTLFGRFTEHVGATARGELFNDLDGARTGTAQRLWSLTLAPTYFLGTGREGIFANVEHTTFRIPRFQIRAGLRYDYSTSDFFESGDGPTSWDIRYVTELVATF
jgi:hypothetical protein